MKCMYIKRVACCNASRKTFWRSRRQHERDSVTNSHSCHLHARRNQQRGVFRLNDLPIEAQLPGAARDALLLRVIGSPDPYGKQIDGMGGATSSTSKIVIASASSRADHDVDYLFGQVAIDKPFVDWSGNCGNLSAAVGPLQSMLG